MEVVIYVAKFVCNYTAAFLLKMMIIDTFFVVSTSPRPPLQTAVQLRLC
jgi:hypothetical protein